MEKMYSIKEAKEFLGVSDSTIRRLIRSGHLRAVRFGDKATAHPRISESSLNNLIKEK